MKRPRLNSVPEEENTADQAGWMYADLLLALMVIFLATISFVPQYLDTFSPTGNSIGNSTERGTGGTGIAGTGTTNGARNGIPDAEYTFDEGLALYYDDFNLDAFVSDIERFRTREDLGDDFEIVFAQITGGYDEVRESPEKGTLRAIAFSVKLKESGLDYLANTSTAIRSSSEVPSEKVMVRFTFARL